MVYLLYDLHAYGLSFVWTNMYVVYHLYELACICFITCMNLNEYGFVICMNLHT